MCLRTRVLNFVSSLVHSLVSQIRTPLNGVLGMISLFQHTSLSPEQMRIVDDLSVSAKHLHSIIDDILRRALTALAGVVILTICSVGHV